MDKERLSMVLYNKADFDAWWEGKTDVLVPWDRQGTCPIARYLRGHCGIPDALVAMAGWWRASEGRAKIRDVPMWVEDYVRAFDWALTEEGKKEKGGRQ